MDNREKINRFILDNNIVFTGSDSDLNSNCVIISGFALFCKVAVWDDFKNIIIEVVKEGISAGAMLELERVFKYALLAGYGVWWDSPDAHKMYIF